MLSYVCWTKHIIITNNILYPYNKTYSVNWIKILKIKHVRVSIFGITCHVSFTNNIIQWGLIFYSVYVIYK